MAKTGYVYIMASKPGGTLYVGVTSDLTKRLYEHQNHLVKSFTQKYSCHTLVYYETHEEISGAILREKQIKKWNRAWKLRLVNEHNPEWKPLAL